MAEIEVKVKIWSDHYRIVIHGKTNFDQVFWKMSLRLRANLARFGSPGAKKVLALFGEPA